MGKERIPCIAAFNAEEPLRDYEITRRAVSDHDVNVDIVWSGVCHTDIHTINGELGPTYYPVVPGHEIVGYVREVGKLVKKFKPGDKVGVGVMVDSCRECHECKTGLQQYCTGGGMIGTYNGKLIYPHSPEHGNTTYGGYSTSIVVDEYYVLCVPDNLDFKATAPLLCAGITTYSPLRHYGLKANQKLAIAGLGGLGHMGVKFGSAFGAHVTVLSRGMGKKADALRLGADSFINSKDDNAMKAAKGTFDMILDTVSAPHDLTLYLNLLRLDGTLIIVGLPPKHQVCPQVLILPRKKLGGSWIGGIEETQEMLNFCGEHNIVSDVEIIKADEINTAYARMLKSDVKYRFVIDASTFKK